MPSRKEIVPNSLRLPYFTRLILFFLLAKTQRPARRGGRKEIVVHLSSATADSCLLAGGLCGLASLGAILVRRGGFSSRKAHWDGQGTSDLMMIMPNMRTCLR